MPLHTDPSAFSITALLADEVALVARHEGVPPGAAARLLQQLMAAPDGRRYLLRLLEAELRREKDPGEARKIALVHREIAAQVTALDGGPPDHRAAA